jgi:hypothetical protein
MIIFTIKNLSNIRIESACGNGARQYCNRINFYVVKICRTHIEPAVLANRLGGTTANFPGAIKLFCRTKKKFGDFFLQDEESPELLNKQNITNGVITLKTSISGYFQPK